MVIVSKLKSRPLGIFLLLLLPVSVQAATVSYDIAFSFTNPANGGNSITNNSFILSTVNQTFTASSSTLALNKFDSSLGTLNSALIEVSLTGSSTSGTASHTGLTSLVTEASIARTLSLTIANAAFAGAVNSSSSSVDKSTLVSAMTTGSYSPVAGPAGFSSTISESVKLSALTGSSGALFNSTLTSSDVFTLAKLLGSGSFTINGVTGYTGTLRVTYDYTASAVPEPSTYAAIGGVIALGYALSRRRRQDVC